MPTRVRFVFAVLAAASCAVLTVPSIARAELKVVASDASGVTLRFTLGAYALKPINRQEGRFYLIDAPGLRSSLGEEGRPALPADAGLIGLPVGTVPHVAVSDEVYEDVPGTDGREPEPVGRSEFRPDGAGLSPTRVFARDASVYDGRGSWPAATAELGKEGRWRFQRVIPVRVQPFRYDASSKTMRALRSATVRVDFAPASSKGAATIARPDAFAAGQQPGPRTDVGAEGLYREGLLNYEAARDFRVAPSTPARRAERALGAANTEQWSLRVDTTGVWRVTYAQLALKGFPQNVPTSELSLVRREWVQGQNPPFVEVAVPIRVIETVVGTAGVFDGVDAIEFYGQTWAEREHPSFYRGRFGDADVYFLSWQPGGAPPRIGEGAADRGLTGLPRPASFPSFRHYEKRFNFISTPRDTCTPFLTWTSHVTDQTFTDTLTTFTPDVDASGTVRFRSSFLGVSTFPTQHTHWVRWKRPSDNLLTPVRTVTFNGQVESIYDTTFAANRIDSGTNKIDWRGYAFFSSDLPDAWSGAGLRWYEVTYSRLYKAFRNALEFTSSSADGDFEVEVDGFVSSGAPNVTFYDVTDSTAPVALVNAPTRLVSLGVWAARFQSTATSIAPRHYFAVIDAPQLPDAAIARANTNRLWEASDSPDYLIVTPVEFLPQAQRLADHRRSQGHVVQVATVTDVAEAFDGGRRSDWAIRRYFEFALAQWGSRLALFFGDGSDEARGQTGVADRDWVPVHPISGPVGVSTGNELSASDFWFVSDLTNAVPEIGDCLPFVEPDLYGDMSLGRLPASSLVQATGLVDKLIAYDTQDIQGAWRNRVILAPDDDYSSSTFTGEQTLGYCYKTAEDVFETISNELDTLIHVEGGYRDLDVDHFYLREKLLPLNRPQGCQGLGRPGLGTARDYVSSFTRPQFLTELGLGALVVNFQGHGNQVILAHEGLFNSLGSFQDIDLVSNDGKPFFFLAYACHVNDFSSPDENSGSGSTAGDALGENMVIGPHGGLGTRPLAGAIGSYASSNYELLPSDPTGRNHLNVYHFRALFVTPPSDSYLGQKGARVLIGEAMNLGSALAVDGLPVNSLERRAVETYLLLGDPGTPIQTGAPRFYATANGTPIVTGVRYQPTALGDSIVIDADLVDESRIDDLTLAITGEGARALVPGEVVFTPSYPDTANDGTGRRYHIVWTLAPEAKDVDLNFSFQDRYGLSNSFTLPLRLEAPLYADGQRVDNGGTGPTSANYTFSVTSPAQLSPADFALTVDGAPVIGAVIAPAAGDTTRRLWSVSWPAELPEGAHVASLAFSGGAVRTVNFTTSDRERVEIQRVFAFPTPFKEPPVTFNFTLDSDQIVDVLVKVYTVSGNLVWQRKEVGLAPGYHQLVWDGLDEQGDGLANGTYLYQVLATDARGLKAVGEGKLVRLR